MKPTFLMILTALTSLPAFADGTSPNDLHRLADLIEHKPWTAREILVDTMKLDPSAHELTMKTDEGISLTVSCVRKSRSLLHPLQDRYALKTLKEGDTTSECEADRDSYSSLEDCMNKIGAIAQHLRERPSYVVFNNIPSDEGMWCGDKTDYVKQELEREHK